MLEVLKRPVARLVNGFKEVPLGSADVTRDGSVGEAGRLAEVVTGVIVDVVKGIWVDVVT